MSFIGPNVKFRALPSQTPPLPLEITTHAASVAEPVPQKRKSLPTTDPRDPTGPTGLKSQSGRHTANPLASRWAVGISLKPSKTREKSCPMRKARY